MACKVLPQREGGENNREPWINVIINSSNFSRKYANRVHGSNLWTACTKCHRALCHTRGMKESCVCVFVRVFTFRCSFHNALTRYIHSVRRSIERKELIDSMNDERIFLAVESGWERKREDLFTYRIYVIMVEQLWWKKGILIARS